ncbi:MAG: CDP-diacylglycerol--glycerol-3-phosphate 3-phosphatidyltransferase [Pseudobdellovibrionaceae bacterium]
MEPWKKELPMWITYSRIALVPVIVALLFPDVVWANVTAAALFIVASISDYYDGYFARKYGSVSILGQFMDPIADKILVTSILVMLVSLQKIDPLMVIVILTRDTLIGGLRSVAAAEGIIIAAQSAGKWKTALQMVAIPAMMIDTRVIGVPFDKVGYWVLWFSVILSVTSGLEYVRSYLKSRKL